MEKELLEQLTGNFVALRRSVFGPISQKLDADLSPAQGELLMNVAINGPVRIKDIAAGLRISSGAVTQLIDGLENLNLVERFMNEDDRRVVWVQVNEAGQRRLARIKKQYVDHLEDLVYGLTLEEIEKLNHLIQKIVATPQAESY